MTTDIFKNPEPPKFSASTWFAVSLEIAMVLTFLANESVVGIILCLLYAWFSATCAVLTSPIN